MEFVAVVSVKMACVIDLSNSVFIHTCQNSIEIQDTGFLFTAATK